MNVQTWTQAAKVRNGQIPGAVPSNTTLNIVYAAMGQFSLLCSPLSSLLQFLWRDHTTKTPPMPLTPSDVLKHNRRLSVNHP